MGPNKKVSNINSKKHKLNWDGPVKLLVYQGITVERKNWNLFTTKYKLNKSDSHKYNISQLRFNFKYLVEEC